MITHLALVPEDMQTTPMGRQARTYITERRRRGEITDKTARCIKWRLVSLVDSYGSRPVANFGSTAIDRWLDTITHLSPSSRSAYFSTVRGFAEWLVDKKLIRRNPTDKMKAPRRTKSVPRAQNSESVAALLAVCATDRDALMVTMMVQLGLRCCEVAGAVLEDYDRERGTLIVVGKGGAQRILPVMPDVQVLIDRVHANTRSWHGPIIRSLQDNTSPLPPDTISRILSALFREAGLKRRAWDGVSAHALRHTAATDVLAECGNVRTVQLMLGHASIATTQIYLGAAEVPALRAAMSGRSYSRAA